MQLPVFIWLLGVFGNTISIRFGNHRNSFPVQLLNQILFLQYHILCYTEHKQMLSWWVCCFTLRKKVYVFMSSKDDLFNVLFSTLLHLLPL